MKKIIDFNNWDRKELFNHFNNCTNPFIHITTKIDITKLYNYVKENDLSMYASITFYILKIANKFDEFKYRKEKNNIVLYDKINANFTDNNNGGNIFFYTVNYNDKLEAFNTEFKNIRKKYIEENIKYVSKEYDYNEIWVSCFPWFNFNSLISPYEKENSIPQFIWDKFNFNNGKVTINLMISIHHGFIDGYQLGNFLNMLQKELNNI